MRKCENQWEKPSSSWFKIRKDVSQDDRRQDVLLCGCEGVRQDIVKLIVYAGVNNV